MKISNILMAVVVFSTAGACAQMPVPLLSAQPIASTEQTTEQAAAIKQLEEVLLCKQGVRFNLKEMTSKFHEIGMVKDGDEAFLPLKRTQILIFGKPIVAASVYESGNRTVARVYYENVQSEYFSKKFGVTKVDENADTDEPSFFKQNGKRNKFIILAEGDLFLRDSVIRPRSSVGCVYSGK